MNEPMTLPPRPNERRHNIYRAVLLLGLWVSLAALVYALALYAQSQIPATMGMSLAALLALLCVIAARRSAVTQPEESSLWFGLGIAASFIALELFFVGLTTFNIAGGLLLMATVYLLVRPTRIRLWVILLVGFLLTSIVIRLVPPFERASLGSLAGSNLAGPIFAAAAVIFILSQLITQMRASGLRNRLITTLTLSSFLPVLVVAFITGVIGFENGRQQVTNQLESVAALKEAQVDAWLEDQRLSFESILLPGIGARNIRDFVQGEPNRPTTLTAYDRVLDEFKRLVAANTNFVEIFFATPDGQVVIATNPNRQGNSIAGQPYFRAGLVGYNVQAPVYSTTLGETVSYLSRPIHNSASPQPGRAPLGVVVVRFELDAINNILTERAGLGQTGEAYLVSSNFELITPSISTQDYPVGVTIVRTSGALRGAETRGRGSALYIDYQNVPVIGVYRWIGSLGALLLVEQNQEEVFSTLQLNVLLNIGVAILAASLAVTVAYSLAQNIAQPIVELSDEATRIASGDIARIESIQRQDEIGTLSQALNIMTDRLQTTVDNLEATVAERTQELEKRAAYLSAAAAVGNAATRITRLEDLLTPVTHLISEQFGFYHVGIFLLDEAREFAVLQAANSEGGWRMLARGHRLKVGEQGLVGYVTSAGKPRIQQHLGEDSTYYANPDLPHTRSELALPLQAGGELLGALDVQSIEDEAFGEEDINVLQVLADQVALAIENARLFERLRQSIESERRAFGELSRSAWAEILRARSLAAVHSDAKGISLVDADWNAEARRALEQGELVHPGISSDGQRYPLYVPIRVRGNIVVGVLETSKTSEQGDWTQLELDTLQTLGEQLGIALENARLFEQSQRLAQRERIAAEVSSKVWSSSDVETILQTAVQELGRALNASQGSIRLRLADDSANGNGNGHSESNGKDNH